MLIALCLGIALLVPAGASASNTISCRGSSALGEKKAGTHELDYELVCNEPITGYTLSSNRLIASFEPETLVLDKVTKQPANGESFGCTGSIPSWGVACIGTASTPRIVQGSLATDAAVCSKKEGKLILRLIVTDSDKLISEPFAISSPKCPKPKPKKHKKHKAKHKPTTTSSRS